MSNTYIFLGFYSLYDRYLYENNSENKIRGIHIIVEEDYQKAYTKAFDENRKNAIEFLRSNAGINEIPSLEELDNIDDEEIYEIIKMCDVVDFTDDTEKSYRKELNNYEDQFTIDKIYEYIDIDREYLSGKDYLSYKDNLDRQILSLYNTMIFTITDSKMTKMEKLSMANEYNIFGYGSYMSYKPDIFNCVEDARDIYGVSRDRYTTLNIVDWLEEILCDCDENGYVEIVKNYKIKEKELIDHIYEYVFSKKILGFCIDW